MLPNILISEDFLRFRMFNLVMLYKDKIKKSSQNGNTGFPQQLFNPVGSTNECYHIISTEN